MEAPNGTHQQGDGVGDKDDQAKRRPHPTNKRVWASLEHSPQRVIDDAFEEALRRDPERRRRWVVLVDGNEDQLARIRNGARAFGLFQRRRRYVVPLFQRPYVWEQEEQWEPLWQDIAGRAEAVLERGSIALSRRPLWR